MFSPKAAHVARRRGKGELAQQQLEEATVLLEEGGDTRAAGSAFSELARVYFGLGGAERMGQAQERAVELLESLPPGPELVVAYGRMAIVPVYQVAARAKDSCGPRRRSISESGSGCVLSSVGSRMWRGFHRCELGDLDGIADLEKAVADALDVGASAAVPAHINLADQVWRIHGPEAALEIHADAIAHSRRRGGATVRVEAEGCWMLFDLGRWDELIQAAEGVRQFSEAHGRSQPAAIASTYCAHVLVRRGATAEASTLMDDTLPYAREIEDAQSLGPALVVRALVDEVCGDLASASDRIEGMGFRDTRPALLPIAQPHGCRADRVCCR